ncbi:MAG: O-GlcNAc transferase, partial [Elusimicrobiota bacterium]|nr:O-GlcNAc transferase [Elusimicrobiota bacterium]
MKKLFENSGQNRLWRQWFAIGLIIITTLGVYSNSFKNEFIWDDDRYVTKNFTLSTFDGLKKIWFKPGSTIQYYPMTFTSLWVDYHLWNLNPLGYHVVNVILHILNAILLWLILRGLKIPGAWVAASVFALHPVNVESVAWISERKNVLSGLFYLSAIMAYLKFSKLDMSSAGESKYISILSKRAVAPVPGKSYRIYYVLALVLYLCALFSKTVTCSLPVAILLLLWWKRSKVVRKDILPLIPFFLVGLGLGILTIWMEKYVVRARGAEWTLTLLDRCLIAGRALCFYVGKLFYPYKLTFIYPRWEINAGVWWQYLFPIAVIVVFVVLWLIREKVGKSPLIAVLFFAVTLFPALGFIDVYPMRYSFVADHFQYLASIGLIVMSVSGITGVLGQFRLGQKYLKYVLSIVILLILVMLTRQQTQIYKNAETLWRDTITKNPYSWLARNNLGVLLYDSKRYDEAEKEYR